MIRWICFLLIICTSLPVFSQDTIKNVKKWNFLAEPCLMFPNMDGKIGIGNLPDADVDAGIGDIFNRLKMGAMLYVEIYSDKWSVSSDFIYMKLKQEVTPRALINGGNVTAKQFAWEAAGLRRITPWLEVGLGGLLNSISSEVVINVRNVGGGATNHQRALTKTWVDPMIIARFKNKPGDKLLYLIRGEIGGFGIGSDFAWQVQAYAGYRFSKLFQLTGGYRVIVLDYQSREGNDRFLYDMTTFGPVIRLGFNF